MGIPIEGLTLDANNSVVLMSYASKFGSIVDRYYPSKPYDTVRLTRTATPRNSRLNGEMMRILRFTQV
jgi:hypothetical protein